MSKGNLNLFKNRILLTRPSQDSIEMSRNISSEFEVFVAPLLEIKKVKYDLSLSSNFDIILFTSKNGIRFFQKDLIKDSHLVFTIGKGTEKFANKIGIDNVINIDGDIEKLKKKIAPYLKNNMKILHPTSIVENENLKTFFKNKKCDYLQLGCYTSNKINKNKFIFKKFMKSTNNGIIIFFSGRTAQSFKDEVKKFAFEGHCQNKFVFLLSKKIKNELIGLKFRKTFISKKPNEISLIQEIKNFQMKRGEVGQE